ncbi:hypothetical protein QTP88_017266 [Uroleucon formosanum]
MPSCLQVEQSYKDDELVSLNISLTRKLMIIHRSSPSEKYQQISDILEVNKFVKLFGNSLKSAPFCFQYFPPPRVIVGIDNHFTHKTGYKPYYLGIHDMQIQQLSCTSK